MFSRASTLSIHVHADARKDTCVHDTVVGAVGQGEVGGGEAPKKPQVHPPAHQCNNKAYPERTCEEEKATSLACRVIGPFGNSFCP